jgi:hypothetical protein
MPSHDTVEVYQNTVPFCRKGIEDNFEITSKPSEADIFYMGQFSEGKFYGLDKFYQLDEYPDSHVCDIEGDWFNVSLPDQVLSKCLFTINGLKNEYKHNLDRMFIRPTFSKNLMNLLNQDSECVVNHNRKFTFIGFNDPYSIRLRLKKFLEDKYPDNTDIVITNKWLGSSDSKDDHKAFNNKILSGTFSLCPRGTGVDSVRFLESCYHGRIPIVISDNVCFGYDFPVNFYFQTNPNENYDKFFYDIFNLTDDQIEEYSHNAKRFFNHYVRLYFEDPTKFFMRRFNARKQK